VTELNVQPVQNWLQLLVLVLLLQQFEIGG
jgi:hypothetical protein